MIADEADRPDWIDDYSQKHQPEADYCSDVEVIPSTQPAGQSAPRISNFTCCLQLTHDESELSIFSEDQGDKFRTLIQTIASHSSLSALPAIVFDTSRVVRLPSEKASDPKQSLTLSTSPAIIKMIDAWFDEFSRRDHSRDSLRAVAFNSIFKAREQRPRERMFRSADALLPTDIARKPSLVFPWIIQPSGRFEIKESDVWHFETQVRTTLRALNFMDASLQAVQSPTISPEDRESVQARLPMVVRTMATILTTVFCQFIQLRRDRYLSLIKNVAPEELQRLRHSPLGENNELFCPRLLKEVHDFNKDAWHNSAILHVAGLASTPRGQNTQKGAQQAAPPKAKGKGGGNQGQYKRSVDVTPAVPVHVEPHVSPVSSSYSAPPPVSPPITPPLDWDFESALRELSSLRLAQDVLPVGGRLMYFWREWLDIGASCKVARWFRKGYPLPFVVDGWLQASGFFSLSSPRFLVADYVNDHVKHAALSVMLEDLLAKRAIEPVPEGSLAFFNRVFLIPKRTGGFRLILDVSKLNEYLRVNTFSMDTAQVIRAAVEPGLWGVSVDLSDAFHHIPIAPQHKRFLAFQVGENRYWYRVCPFGLSPIPQVFIQALTPLKLFARKTWGAPVFQYLDDWLLLGRSYAETAKLSVEFTRLCLRLGLLVNIPKSQLTPTQRLVHLGVDWDLREAVVRPQVEKVDSLLTHVRTLLSTGKAPLPLLESLRGQMVSMEKFIPLARINFRRFQSLVTAALQEGRNSRWLRLPERVRPNLLWWSERKCLLQGTPATPPLPTAKVTTDASTQGWGATWSRRRLQGKWSTNEAPLHINALELLTVYKVLEAWGQDLKGEAVLFLMDNRTAVSYVLKQGGTRSRSSTNIAESIFRLVESLGLCISAAYLPGERNALADMLSRQGQVLKTEWKLSLLTFQWCCRRSPFGQPQVDLFANSMNHLLPRFFSPCIDTGAEAVDALSANWPQAVLYAFPPPTILDRVVIKLHQEKPQRLILVAPLHTVAAWYPTLRFHAQWVERIPQEMLSLWQPHWEFQHPDPMLLCLGVWFITWRTCAAKAIR